MKFDAGENDLIVVCLAILLLGACAIGGMVMLAGVQP